MAMKLINGILVNQPAYDESISYGSILAANTNITLPNGQSFKSASAKDLIVILNGIEKENIRDFTVVNNPPNYTQIKFNYDLPANSIVRFKMNV
jgi:hypothetical protein